MLLKKHTFLHITFSLTIIFTLSLLSGFAHAQKATKKTTYTMSQKPITSPRCNEFTFDATGSYDLDNEDILYQWDFGDGEKSNEPLIEHIYTASGDYDVTLTITDNSGLECSVSEVTQRVRVNLPPEADFETETMACVDQPIKFDASMSFDDSNNVLGYNWNFGDGTRASDEAILTKAFSKGGDYKVTLTVDDNSGTVCNTATVNKMVRINEPPIADAGEDVKLVCVNGDEDMSVSFDASNTTDADNDLLTYTWDFGDGNKQEGVRVTHRYNFIDNYDVKLLVNDQSNIGCGSSIDFVTVRLNKAPEADAGADITACPGDNINFDGSNSFAYRKGTLSSKWNFGDGRTANTLRATHIYNRPGQYQASLTVENELNEMCPPSRDTRIVNINAAPTVELRAVKSTCLGNKVQFDASSATDADGDKLTYYWSFGDGSILTGGAKVSHEYKQGGEYRATVIVDDGNDTTCSTATETVTVKVNTPPIADAGPNLSCCVEKEAAFDASGSVDPDGDNLTYTWDFGDGNTSRGMIVDHAYGKSGLYNVKLTVDDNSGTECSKSTTGFVADVNTAPVPVFNVR